MKDKTKIKPKKWNHLAGLIDGDGSLGISAHPHKQNYVNYDATVEVATTHLPTVKWLKETFGGQFYTTIDKRPNRKPNHHWYVSTAEHQLVLLKMVSPLLKLKQAQGETIIEFLELGGRSFHDQNVRKKLSDYVAERNAYFVPVFKKHVDVDFCSANRDDFQYLSGVLDAEGTLSLYENKGHFEPRIQLPNTDMRMHDFVLERFGGSVTTSNRGTRTLGNWTMPARFLENSLLAMVPYMVTKREQAILLLEWLRNRQSLSNEESMKILQRFRILNHRGSVTTNTATCPDDGQMIESELDSDVESALAVTLAA